MNSGKSRLWLAIAASRYWHSISLSQEPFDAFIDWFYRGGARSCFIDAFSFLRQARKFSWIIENSGNVAFISLRSFSSTFHHVISSPYDELASNIHR